MATALNTIKSRIKENLEQLKRDDILRDVQVDDYRVGILNRNFSVFPVAVLTTPTVESAVLTNTQNVRTYVFEILILMNREDVSDPAQVEDLIDNILNQFDNDVTLKGDQSTSSADAGVEPSTTTPEAVAAGGRNLIGFSVFIRAKAVRDLTFP